MKTSWLLLIVLAGLVSLQVAAADPGKSIFDFDDVPATTQPSPAPAANPRIDPKVTPPVRVPATLPTPPVAPIEIQGDPAVGPVRLSPPGAAVQADLLKMVREIFEKQYAATARDSRQMLARNLLVEASKIRKNHAARFVLLKESLEVAVVAADVSLCSQALEALDRFFTIDVASISQDAAIRVLRQAPPDDPAVVAWVADVAGQLVAAEQYDSARKLAAMAIMRPAARKNESVLARLKAAQSAVDEYEKVKPALAVLKTKPDDPAANLTAGRFLILIRADWPAGLSHLAKCDKPKIKEAATRDLANPAGSAEQFDVAGLWWTQAREDVALQARFEERAAHWYAQARPQLEELKRALAEKRIADVAARTTPSGTPVVLAPAGGGTTSGRELTLDLGNKVTMKLVLIPAGKFLMGSPETEKGRSKDEAQHEVTISKPFHLGVTEVTQEQYETVMGNNPSAFKGKTNPVENVSWNDAVEFCKKVSAKTGKTVRLPTEAEWEYACRAGTAGQHAGKSDGMGWLEGNSGKSTHSVGQKQANAWGLYDMHGNVWEWCEDGYGEYPAGAANDPKGLPTGTDRVLRGGSWGNSSQDCRSARRFRFAPVHRYYRLGFRVALETR